MARPVWTGVLSFGLVSLPVAVVRRGRTVTMLGLPKVRQPLPDVRPWRSG
ncbi:hypothetical protein ACIPYQ_29230 [Streptomyces sp. NPDC090045]